MCGSRVCTFCCCLVCVREGEGGERAGFGSEGRFGVVVCFLSFE